MNCRFCNAEKINANSLRNHERLCHNNPTRQQSSWIQYNKSDTKIRKNQYVAALLDNRQAPVISQETKDRLRQFAIAKNLNESEETKAKRINTVMVKIQNGDWHTHGRSKKIFDFGVWFDSYWEHAYAKYLTAHNIKWIRNRQAFDYVWNGKNHKYFPDFYLEETNEFIEIKGREYDRDRAKWESFPKDQILKVLRFRDLRNAKII